MDFATPIAPGTWRPFSTAFFLATTFSALSAVLFFPPLPFYTLFFGEPGSYIADLFLESPLLISLTFFLVSPLLISLTFLRRRASYYADLFAE